MTVLLEVLCWVVLGFCATLFFCGVAVAVGVGRLLGEEVGEGVGVASGSGLAVTTATAAGLAVFDGEEGDRNRVNRK